MKITGAYTVLDAKTNGFVVNRLNTAQINGIVAVKGMMVYDTDANCLKIFDGTVWSCFTRQTYIESTFPIAVAIAYCKAESLIL